MKVYSCENEIENVEHFLIICPIYIAGRKCLENICNEICTRYEHLNENQKFIFLMSNENDKIIKALGKFISKSFIIREKILNISLIVETRPHNVKLLCVYKKFSYLRLG